MSSSLEGSGANMRSAAAIADAPTPRRDIIFELLGDKLVFSVKDMQRITGKSRPWVYRAMRAGRLPYIMNGDQRFCTRETAEHVARKGVGPIA
jgi:hypothetical protein